MRSLFSVTPTQLYKVLSGEKYTPDREVDLTLLSSLLQFNYEYAYELRKQYCAKLGIILADTIPVYDENRKQTHVLELWKQENSVESELTIAELRERLASKMNVPVESISALTDDVIQLSCENMKLMNVKEVEPFVLWVWRQNNSRFILGRVTNQGETWEQIHGSAIAEISDNK